MNAIQALIEDRGFLLADGATGTMLFAAGLEHGDSPELWNVEHPERVAAIHRGYLEAGAQLILTNTFGGTHLRMSLHKLQDRVRELNLAAVRLLRQEVLESERVTGRKALVAGDIGPTGQVLLPYGELSYEDAVAAFHEQAEALIEGGVDVIWIETISALEEMQAAVEAVRKVSSDIPILMTMTFDTRGRTMMGVTPQAAINALAPMGAAAVGGNCGNGPDEIIAVIEKMHATMPQVTLVAKANAGVPELVQGRPVYRASPEDMVAYANQVYEAGARVIGACCGSTPAHIRAIAEALEARVPG